MSWNHRILAHQYKDEIEFKIHEVYYDKNNVPDGYTSDPIRVVGESIKSITWTLNKMLECRKKPILWAGEKFPEEYPINLSRI